MEFTLYYRGILKANGGSTHKHQIRQCFHEQLKELWNQPPLKQHRGLLEPGEPVGVDIVRTLDSVDPSIMRTVGHYEFAPIVSSQIYLVADLTITVLRPEPPGAIVTKGGDIDNRLKTLLDALKVPDSKSALPTSASPLKDESPFFCLLEDDNLITGLTVKTDRLLDCSARRSEVVLLVHVQTRATLGTFVNLGLV